MVHIKYIFLYLLLLCSINVNSEKKYDRRLPEETVENDNYFMERLRLNGTLQQTAKKYQCHLETIQSGNGPLLLYGTKGWTFPMQDVNLTLRYPSENEQEVPEHVITGVTVILYMDGFDNGGHIKSGGIMEDNILLTFLLNSTSRLSYQFWLYGVKKTDANLITHSNYQDLC